MELIARLMVLVLVAVSAAVASATTRKLRQGDERAELYVAVTVASILMTLLSAMKLETAM